MFGGVLTERIGPKRIERTHHLLALGIALAFIGGYAILAETLAIAVVVTGEPDLGAEIVTMLFLIGGMIAVVAALVYPWYAKLKKRDPNGSARLLRLATGMTLGLAAVTAALLLLFSLHLAGEGEFSEKRSAAITQKTTEEAAVRSRILVLLIAVGRVEQQVNVARARQEGRVIVDGYEAELSTLEARLAAERGSDHVLTAAITELKHDEYGTQASG